MKSIVGRSLALTLVAAAVCIGCGGEGGQEVLEPEFVAPGTEYAFREMAGSVGRIFEACRETLEGMGFEIVSERPGAVLNAKLELPRKRVPIHVNALTYGGSRLYLRVYNLDEEEEREWTGKLFNAIADTIEGVKDERDRRR